MELKPVIVQEINTKEVLMLAYANQEAIELTKQTGYAHFYSRSRNKIWKKGEESGNTMPVVKIIEDCDNDTLLYLVDFPKEKVACHTGNRTCFFNTIYESNTVKTDQENLQFLLELKQLVDDRKEKLPEGSYTAKLFKDGIEKIAKKLGEESVEVVLAAMGDDRQHLIYELADLMYHLTVLLSAKDIEWSEVVDELIRRH